MSAKRKIAAVVGGGVLVAGGVGGGVAWASIPDAGGVVHACYLNATGVVSIIDNSTTSCGLLSTAISWPTTSVHGLNVTTWTPTSPTDVNAVGFLDQSYDCPSGEYPISGNAYYAQNPGINIPMHVDGFHVVSGVPVGLTFQMVAGLTGTYTMQVQVECASPS